MNEQHNHHPDLDALLRGVPSEEADRLREVWDLAGDEEPTEVPDLRATEESLQRLRVRLGRREADRAGHPHASNGLNRPADRRPRAHRRPTSLRRRTVWYGAAALCVVLLAGVLGLVWWLRPVVQTAPPGERLALTLPDDSHVELNSGASLRYDRRFGDMRAVHLEGEAFFEVAKEVRPFVVSTFNAQVHVLGTRFNVRAWPDDLEQSTTVTLAEGRVTLAPADRRDEAITMEPGETRRVAEHVVGSLDAPDLSVEEATAWRHGDFVFKDQPLGTILSDVERRFDVALNVQPASLEQRRLGLGLRQPASAEAVVRDLAFALGLKYRERSNGYELYEERP